MRRRLQRGPGDLLRRSAMAEARPTTRENPSSMTDMSRRTETTWGGEVELSLPIKLIVARVRAHVERRVANGIQEIAKSGGLTDEDILARLESGTDAQA